MKTARLFNNGRSQAVRLPKEFRFKGNDVYVKKLDNIVMLFPMDDPWVPLVNSLDKFSDDFMKERLHPKLDKRVGIK
jgi:antitoxin VapB